MKYNTLVDSAKAVTDTLDELQKECALRKALETRVEKLDSLVKEGAETLKELRSELKKSKPVSAPSTSPVSDPGYESARSWSQLKSLVHAGKPVRVDTEIVVTDTNAFLTSSRAIKFGPGGRLRLDRRMIRIDAPILNEDNHQIFLDYVVNPTYPERWNGDGASVTGSFGFNNVRHATWWGLKSELNAQYVSWDDAELNVLAAEAAALSKSGMMEPITVVLPAGRIGWNRTGRLDGLRATLRGDGNAMTGTRLWCDNARWKFDTSYRILSEDFPNGTTPVLEIGYQRQPNAANPDEGFQSRVEHLSVVCPLNPDGPVSGIMWSGCGLQEGSGMYMVAVSNYGGYGIGGPHYQRLSFNGKPESYYSQLNTVLFNHLWLTSPNQNFPDAIGAAIFGLNWQLSNSTISYQSKKDWFRRPAMLAGSRSGGTISNVHFEHSPPDDCPDSHPCILLPNDGEAGRLFIYSCYAWFGGNASINKSTQLVRNENPYASYTMVNCAHRTGMPQNAQWAELNKTTTPVCDVPTKKQGRGQFRYASSKSLSLYSRQYTDDGVTHVTTTDPELEID